MLVLPIELPYTITPEIVAHAAKTLEPKVLYPYHYGETDPSKLALLLTDNPEIDTHIRRLR